MGGDPLLESRYETARVTSYELTETIRKLHRKGFLGTGESGLEIWIFSASISLLPNENGKEKLTSGTFPHHFKRKKARKIPDDIPLSSPRISPITIQPDTACRALSHLPSRPVPDPKLQVYSLDYVRHKSS